MYSSEHLKAVEAICCKHCTDGSTSGIWCNDENCKCHGYGVVVSTVKRVLENMLETYKISNNGRAPYDLHGYSHAVKDVVLRVEEIFTCERDQAYEKGRNAAIQAIKDYRISDWSDEQAIYNQLEEIIGRIEKM